jgi:hypothetical protein
MHKQFYGLKKGSPIACSNWEMIWTDIWGGSENDCHFEENEIIEEDTDGILKIFKCFYPNDGRHFFYCYRKDLVCL